MIISVMPGGALNGASVVLMRCSAAGPAARESDGLCGGGVQSREVYCVQANAELLSYINNNKDKQGTGMFDSV